jgi:nicotinate-nucleotide adenylyltransferase
VRVYYGGSFNPPHVGHNQILHALLRHPGVSFVHLVPTSQNPLKSELSLGLFTYEQRWQLVESWISDLKRADRERVILESIEIDTARAAGYEVPQYTIDTFSLIAARYPGESWGLAVGQDILLGLPNWKEVEKLLQKFSQVLLFARGSDSLIKIPAALSRLTQFVILTEPIANVSGSEIRESLDSDGTTASALLPGVRQKILDFIG